jgi:hypothetical protein
MTRSWQSSGRDYALDWAGKRWTLRLDSPHPGLYSEESGPLLSLEGVSREARWDPDALSVATMVQSELRFDRVEATYQPPSWGDLSVRVAWSPWGDSGIDLEVQLSAHSVGELSGVEVNVRSQVGQKLPDGSSRVVVPRDALAAALSYDGRESDLGKLSTDPTGEFSALWMVPKSGRDGWTYVEMAHPEDASRRVFDGTMPYRSLRYALFGYDLERGVVLRARLRGLWLPKERAHSDSDRLYRAFLTEPLPLST